MTHLEWNKLGLPLSFAACLCAGVAAMLVMAARQTVLPPRPVSSIVTTFAARSPFPPPLPRPRFVNMNEPPPVPRVTPHDQAHAGNTVVARCLARSLSEAARSGNQAAVDDMLTSLPKFGEAARTAIQEELDRVRDPKAREALLNALDKLRS